MFGNNYTPYSLRISEDLHAKLRFIADKHKRSENKEIEFVLERYVEEFEKEFGEIVVDN